AARRAHARDQRSAPEAAVWRRRRRRSRLRRGGWRARRPAPAPPGVPPLPFFLGNKWPGPRPPPLFFWGFLYPGGFAPAVPPTASLAGTPHSPLRSADSLALARSSLNPGAPASRQLARSFQSISPSSP